MRFYIHPIFALAALSSMLFVSGCGSKSPKDAAKAFAAAIEAGDGDTANKYCTGADPKTISAMAKMSGSAKKYHDAMISKFGASSISSEEKSPFESKNFDEATETIDGDTATLTMKDSKDPLKLKKVDGSWKVDASELTKLMSAGGDQLAKMSDVMSSTADDINAGKFKSADEARMAMGKKMMGM